MPTFNPTLTPTTDPSQVPTLDPTASPTAIPTRTPSVALPLLPVPLFVSTQPGLDPKASSSVATANYYYVFHLYRCSHPAPRAQEYSGRVLTSSNLSTPTGALASARCIPCSPRQGKASAPLTHCACLCFSGPCAARGKGHGHAFTELRAMHGFRFTYYERYEELMKEGRSESNARAEATAAAETAVKNAVLPYKARRPRQLEGWER